MIRVLYFARLREDLGTDGEALEWAEGLTLGGLRARLAARGGRWAEALDEARLVLMAVNQEMADSNHPLQDRDEIALFPPVTGG